MYASVKLIRRLAIIGIDDISVIKLPRTPVLNYSSNWFAKNSIAEISDEILL